MDGLYHFWDSDRSLAFVRSGYMDLSAGYINYIGHGGDAWSHTSYSSTNARNLNFDTTSVNPSDNNNRYNGFPLRCLYPGN